MSVPLAEATAAAVNSLPDIPGYDVESEVGRGGMGVVYRVRRHRDDAILALKMILWSRSASFTDFARFRIEAEALACLHHPNIIGVRDVGMHDGYPYFAMPFAAGGSLRQVAKQGPQKPRWAAEVVRTAALAMQHAHDRGMLHRDLKPANVLLMADGTPVITDFGLVKFADPVREVSEKYCTVAAVSLLDVELSRFAREFRAQYGAIDDLPNVVGDDVTRSLWERCAARTGVLGDGTRLQLVQEFLNDVLEQAPQADTAAPMLEGLTETGAVMGSPNYMAPEQAVGDLAAIGPRTDVYGLGGILYELLTGQPALRSDRVVDLLIQARATPPVSPRQLVPTISDDIAAVCLKCLEKSPDSRYQTAAELAEDLSLFLDGYSPRVTAWSRNESPAPGGDSDLTRSSSFPDAQPTPDKSAPTRSWWPFGNRRS
jgi:serine/threonine protein kinase